MVFLGPEYVNKSVFQDRRSSDRRLACEVGADDSDGAAVLYAWKIGYSFGQSRRQQMSIRLRHTDHRKVLREYVEGSALEFCGCAVGSNNHYLRVRL